MNKYTDLTTVKNYLLVNIDASYESQMNAWIEQVSKWIETYTGRVFIADSSASTRKFEINVYRADEIGEYYASQQDLFIDECVDVGGLVLDDEVIENSYYITYPANILPITRIHLTDDSGLVFTEGEQNIEVSAKWGHSLSCPADISLAAMILVAGVVQDNVDCGRAIKSVSLGTYNVTYTDAKQIADFENAMKILDSYRKIIV